MDVGIEEQSGTEADVPLNELRVIWNMALQAVEARLKCEEEEKRKQREMEEEWSEWQRKRCAQRLTKSELESFVDFIKI
eukprot:GABW01003056.1.p1 GENE.GABW01003056.1~~GABW01003056.1.p1  ORF type:complete len:79 (+),score=23.96 GABW01003056.1:223-459(+)